MTREQFINKMLGVRWENRAASFDAVDCYGLVYLYYKHVLGIEISDIDLFNSGTYDDSVDRTVEDISSGNWKLIERPVGDCVVFMCFKGERPCHIGIVIDGNNVLHCHGGKLQTGTVQINSIRAVGLLYGKVSYYVRKK